MIPGPGGNRKHWTSLVHKKSRKLDEVRNEINVTPLVDVCLVLLIIFMVVTPMLTRGKEVSLPKAKYAMEKKDTGEQPIVSVVLEGQEQRYYMNQDPLKDLEALKSAVEGELARNPGYKIFVKADNDLTYGQVYPALIAIQEAGSPEIELGTSDLKE